MELEAVCMASGAVTERLRAESQGEGSGSLERLVSKVAEEGID